MQNEQQDTAQLMVNLFVEAFVRMSVRLLDQGNAVSQELTAMQELNKRLTEENMRLRQRTTPSELDE